MTLETSRLQSGNPLILRFCAYQKYHLQQVVVVVIVVVVVVVLAVVVVVVVLVVVVVVVVLVLVLVLSLLVDPPLTCFTRWLLGGHTGHRSGREQQSLSIQGQPSHGQA